MINYSKLYKNYDKAVAKVQGYSCTCNILFVTDMHSELEHNNQVELINSLKYVIDNCRIDALVCGGDIGNDYAMEHDKSIASYKRITDAMYALDTRVLCCIGNHDDATGINTEKGGDVIKNSILPYELYPILQCDMADKGYFAYDVGDVRIICLNTSDIPYVQVNNGYKYNGFDTMAIGGSQLLWLCNALKTDKKVAVFSHAPLINDNIKGCTCEPINGRIAAEILEAFASGKVYKASADGDFAYNVEVEFKGKGRLVGIFSGHTHYINTVKNCGINMLTSLCSWTDSWDDSPDRNMNDETVAAFEVISICENKAYITGLGAGVNREIEF